MYNRDAPYRKDGGDNKSLVELYSPESTPRTDNSFAEWLYGEYDEGKLSQFEFLYALPGVRDYFDYLLDVRADREYLNRNGLDYTDIHDPRKLRESSSGARMYGHTINFVSDNIKKLY